MKDFRVRYFVFTVAILFTSVGGISAQETTYFDKESNSNEAGWRRGLLHRILWSKAHQEETNSMLYVSGFETWGTLISRQNINPTELRIAKEQRIRNSPFSIEIGLDMAFRFRNEVNTFSNVSLLPNGLSVHLRSLVELESIVKFYPFQMNRMNLGNSNQGFLGLYFFTGTKNWLSWRDERIISGQVVGGSDRLQGFESDIFSLKFGVGWRRRLLKRGFFEVRFEYNGEYEPRSIRDWSFTGAFGWAIFKKK